MNLESDVDQIISTQWNKRKGNKVPSIDSVALKGGAVELDAVFLYADMAKSSQMAKELDQRVTAKILKSFHITVCKLIRSHNGVIQSFDGDRVMGVFTGDYKNSNAAKCSLKINYAVIKIIRPKFEEAYSTVRGASFDIQHGVGIDKGTVLTVRAGAHGNNDLIWIGKAPNMAAKLSEVRESPYHTFITASVYNCLSDESKFGGTNKENMWQSRTWPFLNETKSVYRSNWTWTT